MDLFVKSWRGEASLAKAFWLVFILLWIILFWIISLIVSKINPHYDFFLHGSLIGSILFPYTLFSSICVWRCGQNSKMIWKVLTRIIVMLFVIFGLLDIYQMIMGPHILKIRTPTTAPRSVPIPATTSTI